jgi:hypothetical protein
MYGSTVHAMPLKVPLGFGSGTKIDFFEWPALSGTAETTIAGLVCAGGSVRGDRGMLTVDRLDFQAGT